MSSALTQRRAYIILIATTLSLFGSLITYYAYTPLLPLIMDELHLSYTEASLLALAQTLVYASLQIPMGYLADLYGPKFLMSIGGVGVGLASVVFSFSNGLIDAMLARAFIGASLAGVIVPSLALLGILFGTERRGFAIGVFGIGEGAASVSAYISPLIALSFGWRLSLAYISTVAIATGALTFVAVPKIGGRRGEGEKARVTLAQALSTESVIMGLLQFGRLGILFSFMVWIATYLFTSKGLDLPTAGLIQALTGIVSIPAAIFGGMLSDKLRDRIIVVLFAWIGLMISIPLLILSRDVFMALSASLMIGWFVNMLRSPLFAAIPEVFGSKMAGTFMGLHNMWANIGGTILPFLMGYIRDVTGSFDQGFLMLLAISFSLMSLSVLLRIRLRRLSGSA